MNITYTAFAAALLVAGASPRALMLKLRSRCPGLAKSRSVSLRLLLPDTGKRPRPATAGRQSIANN